MAAAPLYMGFDLSTQQLKGTLNIPCPEMQEQS